MKIKNVLKLLKKADDNTFSEIQKKYPADWDMDELFDKSYEKYLVRRNIKEDTEDSITVECHAEKRYSAANLIVHRIIPTAACFALIAVSARFISAHSSNNKTENPDVYNNVNTTFEKINEESNITSKYTNTYYTDTYIVTTLEERITDVYTVTKYVDKSSETVKNTEKISNTVIAVTNNDSIKNSETTICVEEQQNTVTCTKKPAKTTETSEICSHPPVSLTTVKPLEKRKITLDDILRLSHKGNQLDWSDFNDFECTDVGSGLYINEYNLEESEYKDFVLRIGGIPEEKPYYIALMTSEYGDKSRHCDITASSEEQIIAFLNENKPAQNFTSGFDALFTHTESNPGIKNISVTSSLPGGNSYSFDDDAYKVADYLTGLKLSSDFSENPDEYDGMTWVITVTYVDDYVDTIYHFGNMFIRNENGSWYKMDYDEAVKFDSIIYEIDQQK